MALCSNGNQFCSVGVQHYGAGVALSALPSILVSNFNQTNRIRNLTAGEGITSELVGLPSGYRHPAAWMMPQKPGALATSARVSFSATGAGALGLNAVASITLDMAINQAALALVVGGTASITFSIDLTPAIAGALFAETSFTGVSFTTDAVLGAKSGLGTTITMTFTPTATATANGSISATISGAGEAVTPQSVAAEVWNSVAAVFNAAGTMGNKMNSAASAGDPWGTPIPASYLAGTAGQILGTLQNDINLHTDSAVASQEALLELSSFDNRVSIDTVDGTAGTAYPLGVNDHPVDNMIDALAIMFTNGFGVLTVKNALSIISSNAIDSLTVTSESWPVITISAGVPMENTVFERVSLYGEFEGFWNILNDCWAYDITNFSGWVRGGSIGKVALSVGLGVEFGGQCFFDNIVPLFPGVPAEITANINSEISITNNTDLVLLKSMTTGCVAYIGLSGGTITIDASCTGGTIVVSGVGTLVNNSAVAVDSTGLAVTLAIAEASPIAANVAQMNGTEVIGTGVTADKWRGVGEPA